MSSRQKQDDGFTGLEAAIVLIAFIVVAAVFSYVVLGAGFFTTQKAQETVHTGVAQATSALEPSGPVSILAEDTDKVANISFYLQVAAGGTGVDMGKVIYTVATPKKVLTFTNRDVMYTWVKENVEGDSNHNSTAGVLNLREMVIVDINPGFSAAEMTSNDKFIVEVKPPIGAALPISRTVPQALVDGHW